MKKLALLLIVGTGFSILAGSLWGQPPSTVDIPFASTHQNHTDRIVVTLTPGNASGQESTTESALWQKLLILPPGASGCTIVPRSSDPRVEIGEPVSLGLLRGRQVVTVPVVGATENPVVFEVRHDGTDVTGMASKAAADGGSYLIITTDAYLSAVAPLASWKRQKGWPTEVVTTATTGTANSSIKAWLKDAYENWDTPPEYVLFVGDVGDIPSWTFSGNVTDHPYACLDGDDWLPDVMVGRFSVESTTQAEAIVAKSVAYERTPYFDEGSDWFTRSLMVAGNYGSSTPWATVTWCGEQLQSIGFAPAEGVYYAPPWHQAWDGYEQITPILETGVSMVVYRGWALGVYGWQPPTFTVEHIPGVSNGAKTPVVMSFVCHTGDFAHTDPCFGEIFLRQGSATESKGAVAFIGNGEHWSTTRFNDAMAYSFFERIIDPQITDLGNLILAGKLRFLELFPLELESGAHGEASVEFYFHIYNLLGDPELNFYKKAPSDIVVSLPSALPAGSDHLAVTVSEADGTTPLPNARIGVTAGDQLLGWALSGANGTARVATSTVLAGQAITVTVSHPDRVPFQGTISSGNGSSAFLAVSEITIDDDAQAPSVGNGDGVLNPGETVALAPRLANSGATAATGVSSSLACTGPVSISPASITVPDIAGGADAATDAPFVVAIEPTAADGTVLPFVLTSLHASSAGDPSLVTLTVAAPDLLALPVIGDDGIVDPGEVVTLQLALLNSGSAATMGGTAALSLADPSQGTLGTASVSFGSVPTGGAQQTLSEAFTLDVAADATIGSSLVIALDLTTSEGYQTATSCAVTVGTMDIGEPVGPDAYGYYAYDSADIDYPDQVPVYRWTELSPTFGGTGTEVPFPVDALLQHIELPISFQFYGVAVDSITISDNGWISFDSGEALDWWNLQLPNAYGNGALVAPFWDNIDPRKEGTDGVYYAHDAGAGTFTIQWTRMQNMQEEIEAQQTFQVILRDPASHATPTGDGEIIFQYKQVTNNDHLHSYATAGIENAAEQIGLQLTYSNVYEPGAAPLSPGLAVRITTAQPVHSPLGLASYSIRQRPEGTRLTWQPSDARPVTGWRVMRHDGAGWLDLHDAPLPAASRSYLDASSLQGEEGSYLLVAMHPFDQQTEIGPLTPGVNPAESVRVSLLPCWPNPVHDSTKISFILPPQQSARLRIYDAAGRCVRTLWDGPVSESSIHLNWDGRDRSGRRAAGGIYFYRLESLGDIQTRKLLLVR